MTRWLRQETLRARELRRCSTPAERKLWHYLRDRRFHGIKFRRQVPLGPFIADFFSQEARLVIEADGAHHFPRPERDRCRDACFRAAGLHVLRIPNRDILQNTQRVLEQIRAAVRQAR